MNLKKDEYVTFLVKFTEKAEVEKAAKKSKEKSTKS